MQLNSKISEAVKAAEKACDDGQAEDCATAWDEVEELSAAASHKKDAVCSPFTAPTVSTLQRNVR